MADKRPVDDVDSDDEEVVKVAAKEPEVVEDATLANPDVVTKYQEAAKIVQAALVEVSAKAVVGAKIVDIARFGDELIEQRTNAIYKNKNKAGKVVSRGVAFPVCISVNETVCHCSPLESDTEYPVLAADDVVKIDLGAHIDGFIVLAAHTVIVGQDASTAAAVAAGRRAAVINATYTAAEVAAKLIKNGNTNSAVTAAIKQVAEMYDVRPISGTLMHQMKQYVIDGKKMILLKELEQDQQKVEACTFETGEVYAIDIAMSTGDGKPRDLGMRTTVYKRAVDQKYALKNKASREFFNEVNKRYPTLPFSTRSLPDEKAAKLGVRECVTHGLMLPYPVLHERKGDFVAHTKFTVLLLPNGTLQVSGLPPVTYNALVATGAVSAEGVQTLNGNIGKLLFAEYQKENPSAVLPENIAAILNEVKPENKKKAKKAAKAAAVASTVA